MFRQVMSRGWFCLKRTHCAQPVTASAPAVPIQVAASFLSASKRPTFCESPALGGKKPCHRPPSSPDSPKNPQFRHPLPGDTSPLLQPFPHPYHVTQCPLPNTANLAPPDPPTCPPKPFPRPPIQPHDPPNALLELAKMRGNEREIDLSVLSPRNYKWVRVRWFCSERPVNLGAIGPRDVKASATLVDGV